MEERKIKIDGRTYEMEYQFPGDEEKTLLLEISEGDRKTLVNLLIKAYKNEAVKTYADLLKIFVNVRNHK